MLGCLTFWILGFGFVFFSVAFILAVVAMCTNQVKQGIILFVSTFASLAVCVVLFMVLVLGTFGAVAIKAIEEGQRQQTATGINGH